MRSQKAPRVTAGLIAAGVLTALIPAQAPDKLAAFGEFLFSNKALSMGRTTSCATCSPRNR